MSARPVYLASFLILAAAQAAHADGVADFAAGRAFVLESATVDAGNGPHTSTGGDRIEKAGDSLDFTLQASDLGVDLPLAIHFRGSRQPHGRIDYTVDEAFTAPIELGGGIRLVALTGRLTLRVVALPGREAPDPGNVRLLLAAPTAIVARTDLGDVSIAIARLAVQGGVAQPALAGFWDPTTTTICSGRGPTFHDFAVSLAGPARASGAVVAMTRPIRAAVGLAPKIVVPAGRESTTVTLRIEPGFVGRVALTAAAGGVTRSLDVDVRPSGLCPIH